MKKPIVIIIGENSLVPLNERNGYYHVYKEDNTLFHKSHYLNGRLIGYSEYCGILDDGKVTLKTFFII